ncbi:hypothetical protein CIG75_10625 [Tumebacillus algifaecis]|uniref:Uncharacterized protein n=1 Tax=Tumebacillus algifaecis TaxID=1214604 RepID=A0A223D0W2_9BACL|nr:hypothetical protein CIG75_10625 [Tumebacillus algifaecis]
MFLNLAISTVIDDPRYEQQPCRSMELYATANDLEQLQPAKPRLIQRALQKCGFGNMNVQGFGMK